MAPAELWPGMALATLQISAHPCIVLNLELEGNLDSVNPTKLLIGHRLPPSSTEAIQVDHFPIIEKDVKDLLYSPQI